jgi:flagellar hook-associated protein 1 FlgK
MADLFTSALSGMNAAQIGLATTEHNIANASTPGYTRQEVQLSPRAAQQSGAGFVGEGVSVAGVKRIYDQFLNTQVLQEQTQASYLGTYYSVMKQIDNLVADPTAGASPAMQSFFDATNGVANNPESIPARQVLLGSAQFVANRFQAIDQRLADIAEGLNGQIIGSVNTINTLAKQISALNGNIKRATAASLGLQEPNDLINQRDQLITQLNKEIRVSVQNMPDGTANVSIGNGQVLVIDEQVTNLRVVTSSSDPSKLDVAVRSGGVNVPLQQNSLQGGNLGAYIAFRDQSLDPARNALGRVALGLAVSVNQQNQMGLDLRGVAGGNIFTVSTPQVISNANNSGTASVLATISDVGALTTSDYELRYDGANYRVVRLSDNTVTSLGSPALPATFTVDGITVSLTAGANAGDRFLIKPIEGGARDIAVAVNDPVRIAAAAPMRGNATIANTGSGKISSGVVNTPLPLDPNLQNTVTVTFIDATHFTVDDNTLATSLAGATLYDPDAGATVSFNGWTVQITGTPSTNDTFTVSRNTNATGDNRNALLMSGLQLQNLMDNGTASLQSAYGALIGDVGAKTHELEVTSKAQDTMTAQTVASQQSVSGVNLDEEAANLLRYQKAYQAAAKAMSIAQTMFDALLSIGR